MEDHNDEDEDKDKWVFVGVFGKLMCTEIRGYGSRYQELKIFTKRAKSKGTETCIVHRLAFSNPERTQFHVLQECMLDCSIVAINTVN